MSGPECDVTRISWDGRSDDARRLIRSIEAWSGRPELAQLVAAFGGPSRSLALDELEQFAAAHWDFRAGRERNLARSAEFTPEQIAAAGHASRVSGMLPGLPERQHYDSILMTGGMVRAGIVKPRFVASLLARGISADEVVFLGAHRPFAGDEIELADALGVDGSDEFDAMRAGVLLAFGGLAGPRREGAGTPGAIDAWRSIRWSHGPTLVEVLAAPSSDPARRRANTADTYRFWLERAAPGPHHRVLIVTTPVYVPYQSAVGVELLGLGAGLAVETVGADGAAQDLGPHTQVFTPANHLQELRAAVSAFRSLRAAAMAAARG